MITSHAKLIASQLPVKCQCGQPATRWKVTWLPKIPQGQMISVLPGQSISTAVDGSYSVREDACDKHGFPPDWHDYIFAEAVRELMTETES